MDAGEIRLSKPRPGATRPRRAGRGRVDANTVKPLSKNPGAVQKPDQGAAAAEGARRAIGDAAGNGRGERFSARRKRETVLRLLRGEDLESVSRELGITAARASQWRDQFLAAGQASLKSRAPDARDEANRRLQAKIGELLMENELLYAKVDQLEAAGPLARRRSRR